MSDVLLGYEAAFETSREGLVEAMTLGADIPTVETTRVIELSSLRDELGALDPSLIGTKLDSAMVEPIHRLLPMGLREAARPNVWQWLCIEQFDNFVWKRWSPKVAKPGPAELPSFLRDSKAAAGLPARFLARSTLGSIARNSFARLWWAAETLDADYDLARKAVGNAQLYVDVFERRIGLSSAIATACVIELADRDEGEVKNACRRLQQRAKTTKLEFLSPDQLRILVRQLADQPG